MPDVPYFEVSKQMLMEVSQAMVQAKTMARNVENTADSLLPLTDNVSVRELLNRMTEGAQQAAKAASDLYKMIAREAATP